VPAIVDYSRVLEQMTGQGLRSLYYNSGAFGFADGVEVSHVGWIGPEDSTLRSAARVLSIQVSPPYESRLAGLAVQAWQKFYPGNVWFVPKSHWAYELDFGSRDWMPAALREAGIDAASLQPRTNAAALEFQPAESGAVTKLLETLLTHLSGSDFAMIFPGHPVVCTVHHHKQVWWTSGDAAMIAALRALAEDGAVK
jgi:hypothetical protein